MRMIEEDLEAWIVLLGERPEPESQTRDVDQPAEIVVHGER